MTTWLEYISPLYSVIPLIFIIATIMAILYILLLTTFTIRKLIADIPYPDVMKNLIVHKVIGIIIGVLYVSGVLLFAVFLVPLLLFLLFVYFCMRFGFPILIKKT